VRDLTVIIPSRNEEFLGRTIEDVIANKRADTEVIAILDGYWPDPPIQDHSDVTLVHYGHSVGQRAGVNRAAALSTAKFVMKLDAHCAVDEGFDVKLMADCEPDWTVIPRMYNLHAFDLVCEACGHRLYQGPTPGKCEKCGGEGPFRKEIVWKPRLSRRTDFMRFDETMHFQYWQNYEKRPEAKGDVVPLLSSVGACFFMHRDRFWELGGMDEKHGSWGQFGTEIACKSWLSGGKHMVNKKTWFAHMFRTRRDFSFPYDIKHSDQEAARRYSRDLWLNDKWSGAKKPLSWLINKFAPVPGFCHKTILYYTDDLLSDPIKSRVKEHLRTMHYPVVEVSNDGAERSHLQLFLNILKGLEQVETEYVALAEHDCFYPQSHFDFQPTQKDVFYYNTNHLFLDYQKGKFHRPYKKRRALSGLICHKDLLKAAVEKRVSFLKNGGALEMGIPGACEFGVIDEYKAEDFTSAEPYLDVRHGENFSGYRKGKHRTFFDPYWGSADKIFGTIPPGRWYQEAVINGVEMPTRRKNDTNERRWKGLVEPFVSESNGGVFTDLGGNAGFYCRKMADLGFRPVCVERSDEFARQGAYWESMDPKGLRFFLGDIMEYDLTASELVLMANVHYWLTPEENAQLEKRFKEKFCGVLLIGRFKPIPEKHKSPCGIEYLRELFSGWDEVGLIRGRKHFSVMFSNPYVSMMNVDELTFHQQFIKSKRFLPAYNDLIEKVLSKEEFDPQKTNYFQYLKWRGFKNAGGLFKRHTDLINSVQQVGIINPLVIGRMVRGRYIEKRLVDGDHRLIVAKKLGHKLVVCKREWPK